MRNFKILSVDTTYDFDYRELGNEYLRLARGSTDKTTLKRILRRKDTAIASRLGGKVKSSDNTSSNKTIGLTSNSPILPMLFNEAEQKILEQNELTVEDLEETKGRIALLDLDPDTKKLPNGASLTNIVFNKYIKDVNVKNTLYAQNSIVTMNTSIGKNANRLVYIKVPVSAFTSKNYKAYKQGDSIAIAMKASFQKRIARLVASEHRKAIENIKPEKTSMTLGGKKYQVDFVPRDILKGSFQYGIIDQARRSSLKTNKKDIPFNKFLSGVQITALVRAKLSDQMPRGGPPDPPKMKYRTGRFANSVTVNVNYRAKMMTYYYMPLYDANTRYGYTPDAQVRDSIRSVAQTMFSEKFNFKFTKGF